MPLVLLALLIATFSFAGVAHLLARRAKVSVSNNVGKAKFTDFVATTTRVESPSVDFLSHKDGALVAWKELLYGQVTPGDRFVQVFVFSGDKQWYPVEAVVEGVNWRVPICQIGNEKSSDSYNLAVVSSAKRITKAVPMLPNGEAAKTITVRRA
jgi:hypothetical protein